MKTHELLAAAIVLAGSAGLCPVVAGPHTLLGTQPIVTHSVANSQECYICHGFNYDTANYIEPFDTWAGTMMAQAARDPLFWASLDVANHDAPQIGDFCLRCHAPGPWLDGRSEPPLGSTDGCALTGQIDSVFSDFDGVTCHLCHRMMVNDAPPPGQQPFYLENAQFWVDDSDCGGQGEPCRRGPYDYPDPQETPPPHTYQYSAYHEGSEMCGTCHNVTNPAINLIVNGADQGIRFPLERTYREWENSAYADPVPEATTCQACHMPDVTVDPAYACLFRDHNRTNEMGLHAVAGGNSWIPDVIRQVYPNLSIDEFLNGARDAALEMLTTRSASVSVVVPGTATAGAPLAVQVKVTNLTGHKLPTGYPEGRRMWLHVTAKDGTNTPFWESGAYDGATGVLTADAAVKIYRADHGIWNRNGTNTCDHADALGRPIFHFAANNCIALDNRIPPLGFRGGSDLEVRPVGYAYPETAPGSGVLVNYDVTSYSIPVPAGAASPITVQAELLYQTTSKDYVEFQRDQATALGFPDDCIARVGGPPNQSRGALLHGMWTSYGKSAPVTMGAASGSATVVASTPGEASAATGMRVTAFDRLSGDVTISYQPACGSTDHVVYVGPLAAVSSATFSESFCGRGTTGSTSFHPSGGSVFWVIVGQDGAREGSYGRNSGGIERPESIGLAGCNLPQDLSHPCSP